MRRSWFYFALILLCSTAVNGGEVRCIDGTSYSGDVRLQNGQIVIISQHADPVKLDLQSVLSATLREPNTVAPPPQSLPMMDQTWKMRDVGPAGAPGSSWHADNTKFLKGAGAGIGGTADSFFFVYQQMWGEGQMIAHLQALPQHLPHLKAGLMLREKFNERDSKMAFFILRRWMAVVLPCGGGKAMK